MTERYRITITKPAQGAYAAELVDNGPRKRAETDPDPEPSVIDRERFENVTELSMWLDKHAPLGATRYYPDGPV